MSLPLMFHWLRGVQSTCQSLRWWGKAVLPRTEYLWVVLARPQATEMQGAAWRKDFVLFVRKPWHLAQRLPHRGVCVQWTTEFIMSCQLFISTAQAPGAWVIIIFLAQHMAKCLALSRSSLHIYRRGEYGISDRFYWLTMWLLFLFTFTWLGVA